MKVYPLRGVPPDVWNEARVRALEEGITIRAVIVSLLRRYAKGQLRVTLTGKEKRGPSGRRPEGVPPVGPFYRGPLRGTRPPPDQVQQ